MEKWIRRPGSSASTPQQWCARLTLAILPMLASCATAPAPKAPDSYRALGTEPFWSVMIEGGRMTYDSADGLKVTVAAPSPRTSFNGHRYESDRLTVDVTHVRCSDGMSDRVYADTVTVTVAGRTLHGCGGAILEDSAA